MIHTSMIEPTSVQDDTDYLLEYCVNTWERLLCAKEEDAKTSWTKAKIRTIIVDTYSHVRVMKLITNGFKTTLPMESRRAWSVYGGDKCSGMLKLPHLKKPKNWLILYNYKEELPDKEAMRSGLNKVLDEIRTGWERNRLSDYPGIFHKEDPTDYLLFMKRQKDIDEDTLLRFLSSVFDLEKEMRCHDYWHYEYGESPFRDIMYMWVKKDSLEKVNDAYMFNLS